MGCVRLNKVACKMTSLICAVLMVGASFAQGWSKSSAKDTPGDFTAFLMNCSVVDRIALMQSLQGLKIKINENCFGRLTGLDYYCCYAEDDEDVTAERPKLPETYNDVSPETVQDAIVKGHFSIEEISIEKIKKQMVWRRYNKINYWLHGKKNLDYHNDYVVWVAKKFDIPEGVISGLSTFELEREIIKVRFAQVWDKLTIEQRRIILAKIESQNGSVGDKVAIASMSGAAAIATLSTTVAFTGFAFYTSLTTAMCTVAGWFGVTLPFSAYIGATTGVAILSGPVGWTIAGLAVVGGGIAAGWPDKEQIIAFVMTVNLIKARSLLK